MEIIKEIIIYFPPASPAGGKSLIIFPPARPAGGKSLIIFPPASPAGGKSLIMGILNEAIAMLNGVGARSYKRGRRHHHCIMNIETR